MKKILTLTVILCAYANNFLYADEKIYLSWNDIDALTTTVAEKCSTQPAPWKGILMVSRGGIIPAGLLTQKLGIKNVRIICLESYSGTERGAIKAISTPTDITDEGLGWLVVDDLADSGATFRYVRTLFPNACYVALIAKPNGKDTVYYCAQEYEQDSWIVFPWEQEKPDSHL